jgi:hypothetical protein
VDGNADLVIEDDRSDPRALETALPRVAHACDLLLGPYSTQLLRTAGRLAADAGWLLWNHGGSGDDVQAAHPGHIVSVLTPTSRYAEPFLRYLVRRSRPAGLWIVQGRGSFGRQVAEGARSMCRRLGIDAGRVGSDEEFPAVAARLDHGVFAAGTYESDIEVVKRIQGLSRPPRWLCAVAAGVREFGGAVKDPDGIFGIGQWFPGSGAGVEVGPSEADFLTAYHESPGATPDYPTIQAVAGAVIAAHCARRVEGDRRELLWSAAAEMETRTLYGDFKIDPLNGMQVKHETALLRWTRGELTLA